MARVGGWMADLGESEVFENAPSYTRFRVEWSDGSHQIIDALDEANAMRQANNSYVGPAIIVAVAPYGNDQRRTQ